MGTLFNGASAINFNGMKKNIFGYTSAWFLLSIIFFIAACRRFDCPLSSGKDSFKTVELPSFNQIILYDKVNLVLTYDTVQSVKIEAGKNMLDGIKTDVVADTLIIRNDNKCSLLTDPSYKINVYISSNQLYSIVYYGAGDIASTNTLSGYYFRIDAREGSGTINLKLQTTRTDVTIRTENVNVIITGQSDHAYTYSSEAGSIDMSNFVCKYIEVNQKSVRDTYVNITDSITANILYIGNVYYRGNPKIIHTFTNSSGRLIHME